MEARAAAHVERRGLDEGSAMEREKSRWKGSA